LFDLTSCLQRWSVFQTNQRSKGLPEETGRGNAQVLQTDLHHAHLSMSPVQPDPIRTIQPLHPLCLALTATVKLLGPVIRPTAILIQAEARNGVLASQAGLG